MGKNEHRLPDPRSDELCALVAEQLVRRRKDAGWNQEELAARLGLSRQSVSKWECGDCLPDTVNLLALADLYDTSVDELLGRRAVTSEAADDEETGAGIPTALAPTPLPPISTNALHAVEIPHAAPAPRPLSARLPRPLLFSVAWLAIVMVAAVGMSMGYAAYTWLPIIPLYCWMLTTLEKDAANGNVASGSDANHRPNDNVPADPALPVAGTAASFLTASVGTQARIALVALATLVLCGAAFIFMIGWTAGCGPWGLPWVPSWYVS